MRVEMKYWIYVGILILVVGFILFNKTTDCIEQKEAELSGQEYEKGAITVRFPENVTDEEIRKIVKSYGLDVSYISIGRFAFINIPHNTETEWLCEFEKNQYVLNVDYVRKDKSELQVNQAKLEELLLKYTSKIQNQDFNGIIGSFEKNGNASIIIELDDISKINEVLLLLNSNEFQRKESSLPYIVGFVTPVGLTILIENEHVIRIYYNFPTKPV